MKTNTIRYSKEFYNYDDIIAAIKDYKRISAITVSEDKDYYICSFSNCVIQPQRVVLEFNNYLIELMNSRGAHNET